MKRFFFTVMAVLALTFSVCYATNYSMSLNPGDSLAVSVPAASATASPTVTATPGVPSPSPTPAVVPAPALVSPQNPIAYGADPTGTKDSTGAFQSAANAGDILVGPGKYLVNGSVYMNSHKLVCQNPNLPALPTSPVVIYTSLSFSSYVSQFRYWNTTAGEVYGCEFEGSHYPNTTWSGDTGYNAQSAIDIQGSSKNLIIAENGFDSWGGDIAPIFTYSNSNQWLSGIWPSNIHITHNRMKSCNVRGVEPDTGVGILIDYNNTMDCTLIPELQDDRVNNENVVIDHNTIGWTNGTFGGATGSIKGFYNAEGAGSACHCGSDPACTTTNCTAHYENNYFTNNVMTGTLTNWMQVANTGSATQPWAGLCGPVGKAAPPGIMHGHYSGNTCTGATVYNGPGCFVMCP